jgi:polyhydroxybutyrate depolymerase
MVRSLVTCLFMLLVFHGTLCAGPDGAGTYEDSLVVGALTRTYLVHLPLGYKLLKDKPLPLVIVLHGGPGNAKSMAWGTGFNRKADKEGFIVVYPNGTGRLGTDYMLTWNSGNCCGYAMERNIDDVGFIETLIEKLEKEFQIDPAGIYVTGSSNGGMMAYRIACELSHKVAAIAPVAGALNYEPCKPDSPVSVVIFHGTADRRVPYEGGTQETNMKSLTGRRVDKPVSYAVSFWVRENGCSTTSQKEVKGNTIRESFTGGKKGAEVILYTLRGEGHTWPGAMKGGFPGADEPTREISATDVIWEFFANHPKE